MATEIILINTGSSTVGWKRSVSTAYEAFWELIKPAIKIR